MEGLTDETGKHQALPAVRGFQGSGLSSIRDVYKRQAQENAAKRAAAAQVKAQEKAAAAAAAAQAKAARESEKKWRNATKGIRGLFRTVGGALKATFLTAGLYAFFKGMKSLMSGAVGQSKEFSAALAGVKSNLTTAFAPILTAVLPMLTALMNGLATATRAIATFIASIFGQTYACLLYTSALALILIRPKAAAKPTLLPKPTRSAGTASSKKGRISKWRIL